MSKKISKIIVAVMLGIIILFSCLIYYFIQANNNGMIMLFRNLMVSTFAIFFLASLMFRYYNHSISSIIAKISRCCYHFRKGKSLRKAQNS